MELNTYDSREIYCRRLGHSLNFAYCRIEQTGLPCSRIRDCWFERIDIDGFLSMYSEEDQKKIFSKPKDRLSTIYEIISKSASENNKSV